jgi:hypothetical protein
MQAGLGIRQALNCQIGHRDKRIRDCFEHVDLALARHVKNLRTCYVFTGLSTLRREGLLDVP